VCLRSEAESDSPRVRIVCRSNVVHRSGVCARFLKEKCDHQPRIHSAEHRVLGGIGTATARIPANDFPNEIANSVKAAVRFGRSPENLIANSHSVKRVLVEVRLRGARSSLRFFFQANSVVFRLLEAEDLFELSPRIRPLRIRFLMRTHSIIEPTLVEPNDRMWSIP